MCVNNNSTNIIYIPLLPLKSSAEVGERDWAGAHRRGGGKTAATKQAKEKGGINY